MWPVGTGVLVGKSPNRVTSGTGCCSDSCPAAHRTPGTGSASGTWSCGGSWPVPGENGSVGAGGWL